MKKTISIAFVLSMLVLLLSNFTSGRISSFVMMTVNEGPVLPNEVLKYNEVNIPSHLMSPDSNFTGYHMTEPIDSNFFKGINNEAATLGRVLFYDKKLSAMENISCGSCHDQSLSFAENKPFSEGILSDTKRNSMNLNDLGWSNNEHFSWSMKERELKDMILLPLTDDNEIGADMDDVTMKLASLDYYPNLFEAAYGTRSISEEKIVDALVQFIHSMNTFNSRLDKQTPEFFAGFTEEEMLGLEVFSFACAVCHTQGSHLSPDIEGQLDIFPFFFNNGLPEDEDDPGAGEWNEHFMNLFKVPTLRNIELTGPYMHDGRFNTLEEVIDHYSEGIVQNEWSEIFLPGDGFRFTQEDKDALVAFLKTLTDETFLTNEKWSNPFASSSTTDRPEFEDLVLRPNPLIDRATIEFKNDQSKMVSINLLSSDGRLIKHDQTFGDSYTIEKENFLPGLYYVELIMDDIRSTQKLIVK